MREILYSSRVFHIFFSTRIYYFNLKNFDNTKINIRKNPVPKAVYKEVHLRFIESIVFNNPALDLEEDGNEREEQEDAKRDEEERRRNTHRS